MLSDETTAKTFSAFVEEHEARLRHALTARFGSEVGKDASADLKAEVLQAKCDRGFTGAFSCSAAVVWTSADGIIWSRVLGNEADFFGGGMSSITAGPSGLVAVGADEAGAAVWVTEEED